MKHLLVLTLLAAGLAFPAMTRAQAQSGGDIIPLNDSAPGIDIVVDSQPGASGALALQLSGASVVVSDSAGQSIFQMADARAHTLELRFGAGATRHTVTVERLPGFSEAYVRATPLDDLTAVSDVTLVGKSSLSVGEGVEALLGASAAHSALDFTVPDGQLARLVASFSGAPLSGQVVDGAGTTIASLNPSLIDGLSIALESGKYALDLASTETTVDTLASSSVTAADVPDLPAPVAVTPQPVEPPAQPEAAVQPAAAECVIQITAISEVHSGPGATYSLMGYAPRGITLQVGGINRERTWILVGDGNVSGWVQGVPGAVSGDCTQITTFDIPAAQTSSAPSLSAPSTNPVPAGEREEHEDGEAGEFGDD
jgi:hypothetical protein